MLHGLLLVDKPENLTSHDVVSQARKIFNMKTIGHAGTLDPIATGLMVLLLGEATKVSDYVLNGHKGYRVTARLGVQTDSLDRSGVTTSESPVTVDPEIVMAKVQALQGELELPVPIFSAVKVQGQKLYEYARRDEKIEPPRKIMNFLQVKLEHLELPFVTVDIVCSKGSYIRSWVQKLGEDLGCGAIVEELRRLYSAPYKLTSALPISAFAERVGATPVAEWAERLGESFIPLARTLPTWPTLTVRGLDERLMLNGQISHDLNKRLLVEQKQATRENQTLGIKVMSGERGNLLGLLEARPFAGLKIRRIFNVLS